jgi:hypothetical protein
LELLELASSNKHMADIKNLKRQRTATPDVDGNNLLVLVEGDHMRTTVCYFGASIPSGGHVTTEQWDHFVNSHIVQRIGSFTLSETVGYWKGCREQTYILTVIHSKDDDISGDVAIIAELYKKEFKQEAVLINTQKTSPILI